MELSEIGAIDLEYPGHKKLQMFFILPHSVMNKLGETNVFDFVTSMMRELDTPKILEHKVKEINIDICKGEERTNVQLNFNPYDQLKSSTLPNDINKVLSSSDFIVHFEIIDD